MSDRKKLRSPLVELTVVRFKEFLREPDAVFWVFVFPLLLTVALGFAFREKPPENYRDWKVSDYTFYDTRAGYLIDMGVMCEPDSREPWFVCEAHASGDIVDRVVTAFEDSLGAALEARTHGDLPAHGQGAMTSEAAG